MKVRAISGFGVKGPACFVVEVGGLRLLVDCGRGPDFDTPPDLSGLGVIDAVLISHAHRDHAGALDLLEAADRPPVYASDLTAQLAGFVPDHLLPLDGTLDISGIEILAGRAGHAPGGVWLRIGGAGGLLYTGDFSNEGALFSPTPWPRAQALIFDASYGAYDKDVAGAISAIGDIARIGPVLLPAPAAGRGLEMAVELHRAGHEVRLCPVHRTVAATVLERDVELAPQARDALAGLLAETRELRVDAAPSGVMIAAKADGGGGLARRLVDAWADRREVAIVFTGHLSAGTPAPDLVTSGRARFIRWNVHPRLDDIETLLVAVAPEAAMPAFLPIGQMPEFVAALPDAPLVLSPELQLSRR
ncbi:MAG: MBL fold metallo-hydrolase [Alphaproteobacteria bacterium]|nr:MBL fold metallo-hydrolase [Alphaproteobacteria bacterium]